MQGIRNSKNNVCNIKDKFLEYIENIPQGEEAMRIVVENPKIGMKNYELKQNLA